MLSGKVPTGVTGFDPLTGGGLPRGRLTLLLGGPGSGKTLFALESLVHGARRFGEPGVLLSFEEDPEHIVQNSSDFDWKLHELVGEKLHIIDARLPHSVLQGGAFDLEGLLAILRATAKKTGARRVVLDGIDVLLSLLERPADVRREVLRLKAALEEAGLSAILTAKSYGDERLAHPFEFLEYFCDCVVTLRYRLVGSTARRTVRVTKLRGSGHSHTEVPFAVTRAGLEISSASGMELSHRVFEERVSSGVERLDTMLDGGYFRGTSILISGAPGTAKTTLAAAYAAAAGKRGERTLFVSFDEVGDQLLRNLRSVGIDLEPYRQKDRLRTLSLRARGAGPELHVVEIEAQARAFRADNLIIDPISALAKDGDSVASESAGLALLDFAKSAGMTFLTTSLLDPTAQTLERTPISLSTLADTWIQLSYLERGGERNRALSIVKSRGMSHSNQVRELLLSAAGVTLSDVYAAGGQVLMGTLRYEREEEERRAHAQALAELERRREEASNALDETELTLRLLEHERARQARELERLAREHSLEEERRALALEGVLNRRGADRPGEPPVAHARSSKGGKRGRKADDR